MERLQCGRQLLANRPGLKECSRITKGMANSIMTIKEIMVTRDMQTFTHPCYL